MNQNSDIIRSARWESFHPYPLPFHVIGPCLPPDMPQIETGNIMSSFQEKRRRLNVVCMPSHPQVETRLTTIVSNVQATSRQRSGQHDIELTRMYIRAALNEREQALERSNHPMTREQNGENGLHHILRQQNRTDIDRLRDHRSAFTVRTQPKSKRSDLAIKHKEKWDDTRFQHLVAPYKETFEEERGVLRQQNRKDIGLLRNHRSAVATRTQAEAKRSDQNIKNREKWDVRFQHLAAYKEKFGHCKVPAKEKEYKTLRNWLGKQREAYKIYKKTGSAKEAGLLKAERFNKLQSIGVSLDPFSTSWNSRFQELVLFKSQYGHCLVPQQGNSSHKRLGQWLGRQKKDLRPVRDMKREDALSFSARDLERGRLLESVGVRLHL